MEEDKNPIVIKKSLRIFIYAFVLNWIWENAHSSLYYLPNGGDITQWMLARAAFIDALIITAIGAAFLIIPYFRKRLWYALIFGFAVSVVIEWRALDAGRWAYADAMPTVPLLNTGLTPTIQLGILAYFVYLLAGLNRKTKAKLFQCPECGLHYKEKKWAQECEQWCKKNKTCNLEIIEHSEENNG